MEQINSKQDIINYFEKGCKNENNQHINSIECAKAELKEDIRIQELKNWLDYLKR